jgi:RNA polymerase sigma factor (sigma-70 family)
MKEKGYKNKKPTAPRESAEDFAKRLGTKWKKHWSKKYQTFIELTAKSMSYGNTRLESDLIADGLISFLINCDKHNEKLGGFSTLFNYILKQKMFKVLQREKSLNNKFKTNLLEPIEDGINDNTKILRLKKLVFRTVKEMPDKFSSELLLQRYYDNIPVKELAKKYNCNNKKIYYNLRKALAQLKQLCYNINLDSI